jgi:hypothetical protein
MATKSLCFQISPFFPIRKYILNIITDEQRKFDKRIIYHIISILVITTLFIYVHSLVLHIFQKFNVYEFQNFNP